MPAEVGPPLARCLVYQFNFDYRVTMLLVLWALGWALLTLSLLVWLPPFVISAFGVVLIAGHNLLDAVAWTNPLWSILHAPGFILQTSKHVVFDGYPLIPWVGFTAVGYGLGQLYRRDGPQRRCVLLRLGLGMTLAFILIRALNIYGDPAPWAKQNSAVFTEPPGWGYSLPVVYLVWALVAMALYPLCRWFAGVNSGAAMRG